MNINDLTIGQAKELACLFGSKETFDHAAECEMIGEYCIIRTYSAGVWFGKLLKKK